MNEPLNPCADAERIRKRLPDYFKALEWPWHIAAPFFRDFVNDDGELLGIPGPHARNLFHVAKALAEESRRAEAAHNEVSAIRDVAAERERQKSVEGWTPEHDDEHGDGMLARAAAVYAAGPGLFKCELNVPLQVWPWRWEYKPKDKRRNLVRAAALIVAEIERLDRAALASSARKEK